jgi:outer membrane lipoprotein-sorting protein
VSGAAWRVLACACIALPLSFACAPKRLTLPSGSGTPFPAFAEAYTQATSQCRGVRTIAATLTLSGRAGNTRLRGDVDAGFAAPSSVRLEGRAPFGRPVFILAARGDDDATLLLPRDNRVLRGEPPAVIVEALTGVALGPAELRSVLAGCGLSQAEPTAGRTFEDRWVSVDAGESTAFLRQADGAWRLVAARTGALSIEYSDFASGRPSRIRIQRASGDDPGTDLSVRLTDVDINVALEDAAFAVEVPAGAEPLTLDELRRAGPLGARTERSIH